MRMSLRCRRIRESRGVLAEWLWTSGEHDSRSGLLVFSFHPQVYDPKFGSGLFDILGELRHCTAKAPNYGTVGVVAYDSKKSTSLLSQ